MADDKPQKMSNFQGIEEEEDLETYLKDLDKDIKSIQTYLSRYTPTTATLLADADADTLVQVEESADEDKVRIDTGGTQRVLIDGSGIAVSMSQPAGSTTNTIVKENIPKGWIQFNGQGTIAISDSYNVTSIADNGTGKYKVTWNNAFANTGYAPAVTIRWNGTNMMGVNFAKYSGPAVSDLHLWTGQTDSNALIDVSSIAVVALGNQS